MRSMPNTDNRLDCNDLEGNRQVENRAVLDVTVVEPTRACELRVPEHQREVVPNLRHQVVNRHGAHRAHRKERVHLQIHVELDACRTNILGRTRAQHTHARTCTNTRTLLHCQSFSRQLFLQP